MPVLEGRRVLVGHSRAFLVGVDRRQAHEARRVERLDGIRREPRAGAPPELLQRFGGVASWGVRAVGRHDVVGVRHRKDVRAVGDLVPDEAVRVSRKARKKAARQMKSERVKPKSVA